MNLWKADKIMNRLNQMLDHAMEGKPIETSYDETKMSALETKLEKYVTMNQMGRVSLEKEKARVDQLISDISHQTKTPVANLLLYSELLNESMEEEENKELVKAIHVQAEKLSFLIQALVKTSRLENGVIQTVPEENDVKTLLEEVIAQADEKALGKNIAIVSFLGQETAFFDKKWTGEAVYNIVDNAVKYTQEGGRIEVRTSRYPLFARIDIKDNGIGIAEDEIPKIFGRFYKGSTTQQREGVGLGLYLAREIIAGQGGYIKVSSVPGKGSTFSIFLRNA